MSEAQERPLFIPLRREFFEAFAEGSKSIEYRRLGPRWNAQTCRKGRRVVLSLGYGPAHRLQGRVAGFYREARVERIPGWREVYPDDNGPAACILIELDETRPLL